MQSKNLQTIEHQDNQDSQQHQHQNQSPPTSKSKIIQSIIIVILTVVCCALSIFAMSTAVVFFSYLFTLTGQFQAKTYLSVYYGWYLAVTYVAILGFVVVGADTAVFFTKFTQKERIVVIHCFFYIALLISGITALVGQSQYRSRILTYSESCPNTSKFQCTLSPHFASFRSKVTIYFIGYCICFLAYAVLFHYVSYHERRERQIETTMNKIINKINEVTDQSMEQGNKKYDSYGNFENSQF